MSRARELVPRAGVALGLSAAVVLAGALLVAAVYAVILSDGTSQHPAQAATIGNANVHAHLNAARGHLRAESWWDDLDAALRARRAAAEIDHAIRLSDNVEADVLERLVALREQLLSTDALRDLEGIRHELALVQGDVDR